MDLEQTLRDLIAQEQNTGLKLNLLQISRKTGVKYKRLWAFMRQSGGLSATDAQKAYEALSGKSLLPSPDEI